MAAETLDENPRRMVDYGSVKNKLRKEARFMLNQVVVLVPQAAWARLLCEG
jgi:hypothetical protein